jgi:hypothetical protein
VIYRSRVSAAITLLGAGFGLMIAYLIQVHMIGDWLVDDAGISIAYARNLAEGYGLVAQPGVDPVEGYSNPLWVFTLAAIHALGLDLLSSAKALSIGLALLSIAGLLLLGWRITGSSAYSIVTAGWFVTQPGFLIWSVSGLENPLYITLILALVAITLASNERATAPVAGALAAFIALTRPEGALFFPLFLIFHHREWRRYTLSFGLLAIGYIVFRGLYFHDLVPNTYHIKVSGSPLVAAWWSDAINRFKTLSAGLWGRSRILRTLIMTGLLGMGISLTRRRAIPKQLAVALAGTGLALAAYGLLPTDWMGEYRFASPVFPLLPLSLFALVAIAVQQLPARLREPAKILAPLCSLLWLVATFLWVYQPRLAEFIRSPTISLMEVKQSFARFERYVDVLELPEASVMTPDVGGALVFYPQIRVIDLGGLTDRTIARTLGKHPADFYAYIFEVAQPDFIHIHDAWTYRARLDSDPRFLTDYLPIHSYSDPYVETRYGLSLISGDFVRDELTDAHSLELLRQPAP